MATHPLTKTSNIVLSRSHMANTQDWHPSNKVMSTPPKSRESSHRGSVIIINVLRQSPRPIVICHSPSSHNKKKTISNHPGSLKSCVMTQIQMLHDDSSASTTSSSNQATLSSWSIYLRVELTSGQTISNTTRSDQGNDGKNRQWYYNIRMRIRMVKVI